MKFKLFLILMLTAILTLFTGCGGTSDDDKCKDVNCETWQVCNEDNGVCEAIAGKCDADTDCSDGEYCNTSTHNCVDSPCADVDCDGNGTCQVVEGRAQCECNDGAVLSDDGRHCYSDEACSNVDCSGHGTCVPTENGATCECEDGYVNNSANELLCDLSPECSAANPNGTCEDRCSVCQNGTCVPDGVRGCNGEYNDRCDPANEDSQGNNLDCLSGLCFGNSWDDGYCSMLDCVTDTDCNDPRTDEVFICIKYGADYRGICEKLDSECTEATRDAETYGDCSDACGDGNCKQEDLCVGDVCAPECNGENDLISCGTDYECANVNSADFPLYRCVEPQVECSSDADCPEGDACNQFYLDEILGQEAITVICGTPDGELDDGETCDPEADATFEDSCIDGLCLASTGDTEGTCSALCSSSADCIATGENRLCVSLSLFSDTEAAIPLCIQDDMVYQTARFEGMCADGCPDGSSCQINSVASVPETTEHIEYICLSGTDMGEGRAGDACTADGDCLSGYCDTVCVDFCGADVNCPDGYICEPNMNYYTGSEDVKIYTCEEGTREEPECEIDDDCTEGYCLVDESDAMNNACVECFDADLHCALGEACVENVCETEETPECEIDDDCTEGYCLVDESDAMNNACVACFQDLHCGDEEVCNLDTNLCETVETPPCTVETEDTDCTDGSNVHCLVDEVDSMSNACVECVSDTHCADSDAGTVCSETTNTCGCVEDTDCLDENAVCDQGYCALKK